MSKVYVIEWVNSPTTVHASAEAAREDHAGSPGWEQTWAKTNGMTMDVDDVPSDAVWTDGAILAVAISDGSLRRLLMDWGPALKGMTDGAKPKEGSRE